METKKIFITAALLFLFVLPPVLFCQTGIQGISRAYAYREEGLLIGKADLYGTYFLRDSFPKETLIVSAFDAFPRNDYATNDQLVVNRGRDAGLREGDKFLVIGEGRVISSLVNGSRLGRHYQKKAVAEITCLFAESAVITLKDCYFPVNLGDFLTPFVEEENLIAKKIDFTRCRLPESDVFGRVVYMEIALGLANDIQGSNRFVTVDLGRAEVSKGDFMLFYRRLKPGLPSLIIGSGIVIHSENNNSTVKVLDVADPLRHGDYVVVMPRQMTTAQVQVPLTVPEDENLPVIELLTSGEIKEESFLADILFPLDSSSVSETDQNLLAQVKEYLGDKEDFLVVLRGYSCAIGTDEYNLRLSQERVEKIKALLIEEFSIPAEAIETYFYGESEALFDNSTEQERKKNRLVRIEVNGKASQRSQGFPDVFAQAWMNADQVAKFNGGHTPVHGHG